MHPEWTSHITNVFERAASTYDDLGIDFFSAAGEDLVTAARVQAGHRVLDAGCGSGASTVPAAVAAGPTGSVIGIDVAPRMVERTRSRLELLELTNARAVLGDASDPNCSPGTFDVVLAGFVVFFFADAGGAIRRYYEILSSGGRVAISFKPNDTPELAEVSHRVRRALDRHIHLESDSAAGLLPQLAQPTRSTFDSNFRLLADAGFSNITFSDAAYSARFTNVDHYWNWLWSHGMRERLERIPPSLIGEALADLHTELEPCLDDQGELFLRLPVRFAVGERR